MDLEETNTTDTLSKMLSIEQAMQDKWEQQHMFEEDAPDPDTQEATRAKYVGTMAYPYMNGRLHLGHSFSLVKADFAVGFERLQGKRCLFPLGLHCTGMPIKACADKLKREMADFGNPPLFPKQPDHAQGEGPTNMYQWEIMRSLGVKDKDIAQFEDPVHWLHYFPPLCKNDLRSMGVKVDWRRTFITTDANPYFDSFIRWHYRNIRRSHKVKFDRRHTLFSPSAGQPCMDHDLSKGEGVRPVEYGLIKLRVEPPYTSHLQFAGGKPVFLVALTLHLRQGTSGNPGCLVQPDKTYIAFETVNNNIYVCSRRAARNMSYQGYTYEDGRLNEMAELIGKDLIGIELRMANEIKSVIYVLPSLAFNADKGTGIAIGVPSESTDKRNGFRAIDNRAALHKENGAKNSTLFSFNADEFEKYMEPEETVLSRTGDECVVAVCDQWYLDYGNEAWKRQVRNHVDNMELYHEETKQGFMAGLDSLQEHVCSRSYGLGTRLPWDPKYVIDCMSDSNIYTAFYTVAHLLQGHAFDGSKGGPLGISPEQMTDAVWDYIFLSNSPAPQTDIPHSSLEQMRNEFLYWYPLDVCVSGKDLVPSHLTYVLYGHCATWPDDSSKWPRGMRANGHLLLNSEKMSKSTGNFLTISQAVHKFSADGMRLALAEAGDSTEDANLSEAHAEAGMHRLHAYMEWVMDMLANQEQLRKGPADTLNDRVFISEMNLNIEKTKQHYSEMMYKEALKTGFYEYQAERDRYREHEQQGMHRDLVIRFIETQTIILAPICPHACEFIWEQLGKPFSIMHAAWPDAEPVNNRGSASISPMM